MYLAWVDSDASSQSRTVSCAPYPQFALACDTAEGWQPMGQTRANKLCVTYSPELRDMSHIEVGICMVYSSLVSLSIFAVVHVNSLGWLVTPGQYYQTKTTTLRALTTD
jgi:hypothetical protein